MKWREGALAVRNKAIMVGSSLTAAMISLAASAEEDSLTAALVALRGPETPGFTTREGVPGRLRTLSLGTGAAIDLEGYLVRTRLTSVLEEPGVRRALTAPPTYGEAIHEAPDKLVIERHLTLTYDPETCTAGTAPAVLCAGMAIGFDAAPLRASLAAAPVGYTLPSGLTPAAALGLDDEALGRAVMASGTLVLTHVSEVPRHAALSFRNSALGEPAVPPPLSPLLDLTDPMGPSSEGSAEEARSEPVSDKGPVPLDAPLTLTFPDLISADAPLSAREDALRYANGLRVRWLNAAPAYGSEAGQPWTALEAGTVALVTDSDRRLLEDRFGAMPPEEQMALMVDLLPAEVFIDGARTPLNYLMGLTYSAAGREHLRAQFFEGDGVLGPIFVSTHISAAPQAGIALPFHGEARPRARYQKEVDPALESVRYRLVETDVRIVIDGDDVDANGEQAFGAVGLDPQYWRGGREVATRMALSVAVEARLPGGQTVWQRKRGPSVPQETADLAPPIGGRGPEGVMASLAVRVQMDEGELFLRSEQHNEEYVVTRAVDHWNGVSQRAYIARPVDPLSAPLVGDGNLPAFGFTDPRYRASVTIVPEIPGGLGGIGAGMAWQWTPTITLPGVMLDLESHALPAHAGTEQGVLVQTAP